MTGAPVLSLETAKRLYRIACDATASDDEPAVWWEAVRDEMSRVVAAPSDRAAARVIAWWHIDWKMVGDTAVACARRIRAAVRASQQKGEPGG